MKHIRTVAGLLAVLAPFAALMALTVAEEPKVSHDPAILAGHEGGLVLVGSSIPGTADLAFTLITEGDLMDADTPLRLVDNESVSTLFTIHGDGSVTRNCPALAAPNVHVGITDTATLGVIAGARLACEGHRSIE